MHACAYTMHTQFPSASRKHLKVPVAQMCQGTRINHNNDIPGWACPFMMGIPNQPKGEMWNMHGINLTGNFLILR